MFTRVSTLIELRAHRSKMCFYGFRVCCWFSPLLRDVFLRVLRFSPLLQNQHFQIPIRSGTHGHVSTSSYELLSDPWVNKLQFTIFFFSGGSVPVFVFLSKIFTSSYKRGLGLSILTGWVFDKLDFNRTPKWVSCYYQWEMTAYNKLPLISVDA